jgi:hypothetical protein
MVRYLLILAVAVSLTGCATSEINAGRTLGLSGDVPSGTLENGYGDFRGDAVAPPGSEQAEQREASHGGTE